MNERDSAPLTKAGKVWKQAQEMADGLRAPGETRRRLLAKGAFGFAGLLVLDILALAAVVALIRWMF